MRCPRCLNEDEEYFYLGSKGWMCRKCVSFKRVLIEEEQKSDNPVEIDENSYEYSLDYPLTPYQKAIATRCKDSVDTNDVLIEAICGAGKTELVMMTISKMLKEKKKVCFAISRRQVVIELHQRLEKSFKQAKVVKVCQGYTDDLYGDIIVCTTHQCYRYYQYFDCLILDESDAFPYKNNEVLAGIVRTSCKGHMVYLTATIDDYLKKRIAEKSIVHLKLNQRPHGYDLVVPRVKVGFVMYLLYKLYRWIDGMKGKPIIVFVPTIKIGTRLKALLKIKYHCELVSSKTKNRDEIISDFRNGAYDLLIATTILERGITIENVNICIFLADHGVFDEASLVQMSGRVGRSFKYPTGDCLMLCSSVSDEVNKCVRKCKIANENKMLMV